MARKRTGIERPSEGGAAVSRLEASKGCERQASSPSQAPVRAKLLLARTSYTHM
ncbi:hypothetical protein FA13DRAFT_1732202 [Coprinellus micaceus]|uniref:Uncharacterized protein n=1 Tax=Coprinellus micaceus TaxID=71717 RepID=A0A4Y7TD17_COPMI|nr:hypothetical protein FA13DRAFT_1732202 [Coprinellus micaceus]